MTNGEVVSPQGGGKLGGGGQQQLRRDSTQSDDGNIQLVFSSSVDGSARMASTGNDVRDRCRELLAKAMKKGFSDGEEEDGLHDTNIVCFYFFLLLIYTVSIEEEIKMYNLSSEIENYILCLHVHVVGGEIYSYSSTTLSILLFYRPSRDIGGD